MSKSRYKKYITESFLYEADEDRYVHVGGGVYKEKDGKGEPLPNSPKYLKKDNGGFEMVDDDDPRLKKGDDKEKKKPVSIDIDASGGFGDDKPKGERPATIHLDYDQADDDIDDLRYNGSLEDNPALAKNLEDMIKLIDSGHATDEEIEKAREIADTLEDLNMTNDEGGDELSDVGGDITSAIDRVKQGRTGTEEIKVINGKKYKAITEDRTASIIQHHERELEKALAKGDEDEVQRLRNAIAYAKSKQESVKESVNKRVTVKEVKSWLKGLEEFRYRKIPGVDVRRITSFVNNGLSETDLPKSLQKKWGSAKYSKEKGLADRFMKERINKRLTQNESKHPIKEQYDRLFKNKVAL